MREREREKRKREGERTDLIYTTCTQGGDLDQKINQWRESGRSFEETLITDWFIQLTAAVMYIHERRILHRDIKTRQVFKDF